MPTITGYNLIKILVENDGRYYDDPQALSIWEYTSRSGETVWFVAYSIDDQHVMTLSPFVMDPVLLWSSDVGYVQMPTPPEVPE